jgi:hypothetical protein
MSQPIDDDDDDDDDDNDIHTCDDDDNGDAVIPTIILHPSHLNSRPTPIPL